MQEQTTEISENSNGSLEITGFINEPVWFYISILLFALVIIQFIVLLRKSSSPSYSQDSKIQNLKKTEVNMDDLMQSIVGSKELYKKLSKRCHPDRFIGTDKQSKADELFKSISKYKRNYTELIALKDKAQKELNIKID